MDLPLPVPDPDASGFRYDEMGYFEENCSEYGLDPAGDVAVRRVAHRLADGREVSALRWGIAEPEAVLVHGGAQNAHTWDTVALALRPMSLLAVDLPGHGRSSWREERRSDPSAAAEDVASAIAALAPSAHVLVGMSLGGLTSIAVTRLTGVVDRLVLVDITPGVDGEKAKAVHDFIAGPQTFPSFAEIFGRTVEFNPTRTPESLRRGILHNAHRNADGTWEWNYDRRPLTDLTADDDGGFDVTRLWDDLELCRASVTLVRGGLSPVVGDDDVEELGRRRPDARVVVVEGAGHSVQGDRPIELAALIGDELTGA